MTELEIVRLDTLGPNSPKLITSKTNSVTTSPARLSLKINSQPTSPKQQKQSNDATNHFHEIPINIIKSMSYNNQIELVGSSSSTKINHPNATSSDLVNNTNSSSSYNENEYLDNNNQTNDNEENENLRFNKYGFAQNNTDNSNSSTIKSSNNNNNGENVANLKDYLQTVDVEMFAEQIPIKVIQSRELKWLDMLNNFDEWMMKKFVKIKSRCRKGIPQSMRSKAWMHLTGAFLLKKQKPNYYQECLDNPNKIDIAKYVEDIKKDLHRQFPNHEIFMKKEGRMKLFNVLKAYAVHNKEVGYCQAQGPIAALLLMHMVEEDAFWMLVRISDTYLKEYFKPGLEKVQIDGYALFYLFKKENPSAHKLMKQQSIDPILYMTEWFMCIFARTLPWCTVLRVWDMFFCEGIKVLYRVGLYLMQQAFNDKEKFSKCQQQGMYETLNLLKNLPIESLNEHLLVKKSCLIKIDEKDLNKSFEKSKLEFKKQTEEIYAKRKQAPDFKNNNNKN